MPLFERLGDMCRTQAARLGDKAALVCAERTVSYSALNVLANKIANGLTRQGVAHGDRVAYLGKNSDHHVALFLGATKIGAVLTPVNWRLADPEIAWILNDADPAALFADDMMLERVRGLDLQCDVRLELALGGAALGAWCASQHDGEPDIDVDPDSPALQMYTSGTTGRPKGVQLSHRSLLVFRSLPTEQQPVWNRWNEDDVSLIAMPQFHIGGAGFGLQTLCAGATALIVPTFEPAQVLHFIAKARLSKIFLVPSAIQLLLSHPDARSVDYGRIRTMLYGGSPIPLELLREAMAVFKCGFVQQYGLTEACGAICALLPEDHDPRGNSRMASTGRAVPGVEIVVLDEAGQRLPAGAIGEVCIRSPTAMSGYWRCAEATAAAFTQDGFLRTGDAGSLDSDGYLFIRDRVKDMIVSGGENIYPAEVELALCAHPAIREAAVFGIPDARWGEAVAATVVAQPGVDIAPREIMLWMRDHIAAFKIPKLITFATELPRNGSGKILRRELRASHWQGRERLVN